jgi:hypothetical protein
MNALLSLGRLAATSDIIDRLHRAIEKEITSASKRIESAARTGDSDYADGVTDDECELVEQLLGLAFVAGQTFMTSVRTRIVRLSVACESQFGRPLTLGGNRGYDTFKVGASMQAGSGFTKAEVVNAIANYWKHQEDWPTGEEARGSRIVTVWDLTALRNNEKRTVEIVVGIGMLPGNTGNLRSAARVLGVTNFEDLSPIRQELHSWAQTVYTQTREELSTLAGSADA